MSIADCMIALFVMPISLVIEIIGYFPLSPIYCTIWLSMDVICSTSSIHHMSTIALDRYFSIKFPLKYGRNKSKRITLLKICFVWFISVVICMPLIVLAIINERNVMKMDVCMPFSTKFRVYGSIFAFVIPFIIMVGAYTATIRILKDILDKKMSDTNNSISLTINRRSKYKNNSGNTDKTTATGSIIKKSKKKKSGSIPCEQSHKTPEDLLIKECLIDDDDIRLSNARPLFITKKERRSTSESNKKCEPSTDKKSFKSIRKRTEERKLQFINYLFDLKTKIKFFFANRGLS
jgi:hypothetical protein